MSRQSCLVVCALVFLFFAMVSNIVALGSPSWVGITTSGYNQSNTTLMGLWMRCVDGDGCLPIDTAHKRPWLVASEVLYTLATVMITITFFWFCQIFATECSTEHVYRVIVASLVSVLLSFCLSVSGMVVFAVCITDVSNQLDSSLEYEFVHYYGFGMACFGAINTFVSCFLITWEGCFAAKWFKNRPYLDI